MCSVSMVTTDWYKQWANPPGLPGVVPTYTVPPVSREEFNKLKNEVEALKVELKKARQKDIEENAPDCEMKESVELVRKLAEQLGVDLEDVFDGHKE